MLGARAVVIMLAACLPATLAHTRRFAPAEPVAAEPLATEIYRLPDTILPVSYNLTLRPYLLESDGIKKFTFDGDVLIEILPTKNIKTILLHSKNLTYSKSEFWVKSTLNSLSPTVQALKTTEPNQLTDIMTITLSTDLQANTPYILHFVYSGAMEDNMHGFYRSSYVDHSNETKWMATTQFQTHHARRAFPCFDEPLFKATFNVTLKRHRTYSSISNTRLLASIPSDESEYFLDIYDTTPKMSTYLMAFIVSEFVTRTDGIFGVQARPEYYTQSLYAFQVGRDILKQLGVYLHSDYYELGIDKMDMVAIPDFSAGAMENWGLLTYRERSLLYDESVTQLSSKQAIASIVAHEQAHQWFGDSVTCNWWSYAWLNEGFARYFQYFGTAFVEKDWQLEKQFVVDQIQTVMIMDSTKATNPMSDTNTNTPADFSRMFNSITYNKGAAFIRMIEHTMGSENFQKSLQKYLEKHAQGVVEPQNLLDAWLANWPVNNFKDNATNIFNSFTEQVGYPLVTANLAANGKTVEFSQKRFLLKADDGADPLLTYYVPITFTTNAEKNFVNTTPKFILQNVAPHTIILEKDASWVLANIQETGYYRVNYTEKNWHGIHHALYATNWSDIPEVNRAQVVDDLLNLARASEIKYELALDVLEYLETETNYIPWTAAFNGFNYLAIRLGTDTAHFGNYIQQLTNKAYNKLGFEEKSTDNALDIFLRTKLLSWVCRYGNTDCIKRAKSYFVNQLAAMPKNIRSVVYCVALREGGDSEFNALYNKFLTETVATEKNLLQITFGCVKEQKLIDRVFQLVLSDTIRRQDKTAVLNPLFTENSENVDPVFKLVTDNYQKLSDALGGISSVASVISNIAARFTKESQVKELDTFIENNKVQFGSSTSTLQDAATAARENIAWAEVKLGVFKSYLSKRNGSAIVSSFTGLTLLLVALCTWLLQ